MGARARAGTGAALAAFVLALGCSSAPEDLDPPAGPGEQAVSVALSGLPASFNVHTPDGAVPTARILADAVWPSAYAVAPDFSVRPSLLSAEAVVVSESPFVVEWRIRPDATWSDGTPVTVDDFESLYRHCTGRVEGATCVDAAGYGEITRFTRVDDKTLRTTFRRPFAEYPGLFRHVPPAHVLPDRSSGAEGWDAPFRAGPGPSAGPYVVASSSSESIVLERNPDFFGPAPVLARVVIEFMPAAEQVEALRSGRVDVAAPEPTLDLVQALETMAGVTATVDAGPTMERLVVNLRSGPLGEVGVRRAAALALDRDALVAALVTPLHPGGRRLDNRAYGVNQAHYEAHGDEVAARDVARAHAELEAAGFGRDAEGVYGRGDDRLDFRLATASGDARREQALQLIQAQLAEAGIRTRIENAPEAELRDRLAAGDFDLALVGRPTVPFPAAALVAEYGSRGGANVSGLAERRLDDLLAEAEAEADAARRAGAVNAVDRLLWELMPDIPLFQAPLVVAHSSALEGVVANPAAGLLWNVGEWRRVTGGEGP